jgi:pimeloyl-ACP methyl ester carboxylesterase
MGKAASGEGFFDIGGDRLEYRRVGRIEPGRPVLVFLHEGLGCVALWRDIPDRLAGRSGLAAFVYSRAGYGRSGAGRRPLPADYHDGEALDVLPKVLATAGINRPILIGHSDGGTIALINAGRGGRPRALAVVTIAAHVFNEQITRRGIEAAAVAFRDGDLRQRLSRYHGDNVAGAFWGWCDVWLSPPFRSWNVEGCLAGVDQPVLVMQGADDEYGSAAQVRAIAEGVRGPVETVLLPGLGHAPHLERPALIVDVIGRFVDGLPPG